MTQEATKQSMPKLGEILVQYGIITPSMLKNALRRQSQIRTQLADSLLLILSQRLVTKKDNSGLVLAYEKLFNTYKIKNFIREGKTHQIRSQMQGPGEEYSSIDVSLAKLCLEGKIAFDEGARHADNLTYYQGVLKSKGIIG